MERIWLHDTLEAHPAPALAGSLWFNTERAPSLDELRGKVVVLVAFQMVCPGCVLHALPQAARIRASFESEHVEVLGLHVAFDHDDPVKPRVLDQFLTEYGVEIPVGFDDPDFDGQLRLTDAYGFAGTPSLVLIDREGLVRAHVFGRPSDLLVGAAIGSLLVEERMRSVARTRPRLLRSVSNAGLELPEGWAPR
ncbi:peroxiredoxin family protein [Paraliomyxa miuraensis]|uniref:peroxiredoxin family protein n=1 Tax=Paraliomyxa miuraensis TaxID=376150 RepID=UPI002252781F|nr:TlpA disulfide reductase family protein [Paraliomyxa miuraensis]MCX4246555.1 TlpA family protein disulfide reductase [Paraliomyxa miuraensis]